MASQSVNLALITGLVTVPAFRVEIDQEVNARHRDVQPPRASTKTDRPIELDVFMGHHPQHLRHLELQA